MGLRPAERRLFFWMAVSLHYAHDEKLYCAEVGGRKYVNDVLMAVGLIDK